MKTSDTWTEFWRGLGDRTAILGTAGEVSYSEIAGMVDAAREELVQLGARSGSVVTLPAEFSARSASLLFGLASLRCVAIPVDAGAPEALWRERERMAGAHGRLGWRQDRSLVFQTLANEGSAATWLAGLRETGRPGLILFSGGATGAPKGIVHDFELLLSRIPVRLREPKRFLPLMAPDHVGGIDMFLRALAAGATAVDPGRRDADTVAGVLTEKKPDVVAATPSFLRFLWVTSSETVAAEGGFTSVRRVVHGAETMPASLVERLRRLFPNATFQQRFGTTETAALRIENREPDSEWFRFAEGDQAAQVIDGALWLRLPASFAGYLEPRPEENSPFMRGWYRTGDILEQDADGWLRHRGRASNLINVGGEKVNPETVEAVLLEHPKVIDCRAYGQSHALTGEAVAVDLVWTGVELSPFALKRELTSFAGRRLKPAETPIRVNPVREIARSAAGKIRRETCAT